MASGHGTAGMGLRALSPAGRRGGVVRDIFLAAFVLALLYTGGIVLLLRQAARRMGDARETAVQQIAAAGSEAARTAAENVSNVLSAEADAVTLGVGAAAVGGSAALVLLLSLVVRLRVAGPLQRLAEGVAVVSRGNFDRKLPVEAGGEIGDLTERFNEMVEELRRARDRLREYSRDLERSVEVRTEELARRNLELSRSYREKETALSEKERAFIELKAAQSTMVQQERMATLGQLLAGIAHEINNPVNFMVNAIRPIEENVRRLSEVLERYARIEELHEAVAILDAIEEIVQRKQQIQFGRTIRDIGNSVDLIRKGAERTAQIVQNLRAFSRTGQGEFQPTDLAAGLDVTLSLLNHLIKGRIEVHREYGDVPLVECIPGEINQVFMNLLTNACQAVPDSGVVRVAVRRHGEHVVVSVTDSGPGIPQEVRDRIFEPFFTTKPLGLGTGLGLAISYNIVCNKHRRDIGFFCPSDGGTTFTVSLPLKQPPRHGTTTAELPAETLVAARSAREASP